MESKKATTTSKKASTARKTTSTRKRPAKSKHYETIFDELMAKPEYAGIRFLWQK